MSEKLAELKKNGGGGSGGSFKKWILIGSNAGSSRSIAITYANAENVTPIFNGNMTGTSFTDSDLLDYSYLGAQQVSISIKTDCYVYAGDNTTSGAPTLMASGDTLTRLQNSFALYAIEK